MNKKIAFTGFVLALLAHLTIAQTSTEAFRLSTSDPLGTARNLGTGNSMFAIGPDLSVIGSNPSGIGAYWKSEFSITAGASINHFTSYFNTDRLNTTEGNFNHLSLPNMGFVITTRPWNSSWKTSTWAIGINRVADYKREIQYAGNPLGSMTDAWRENATGISPDDLNGFEEALAFRSGAIYDLEDDNIYETDYRLNNQFGLPKSESTSITGGKSELFLGYGANLDNKLLIGLSFNLPFVNYSQDRIYRESDEGNGIPFFNELRYTSSINTTGYGVNGKAGITFKPTQMVHLAIALHTPTKFFLTDNFNTTLTYDYTDENHNGPITAESPFGSFAYALKTPWSAMGGIGVIAGKSGFLSASLKWTDYSNMKYDYSVRGNGGAYNQIERQVNEDIRINYGSTVDLNIGGEMVLKSLRLRGGVSLVQSPFNNDKSFDPSYHAGIGYRSDEYYIDLGYKLTSQDDGYLPYQTIQAPQPLVLTDFTRHRLSATFGLKF